MVGLKLDNVFVVRSIVSIFTTQVSEWSTILFLLRCGKADIKRGTNRLFSFNDRWYQLNAANYLPTYEEKIYLAAVHAANER